MRNISNILSNMFTFALTRALRARRARPPEVADLGLFSCSAAARARRALVRVKQSEQYEQYARFDFFRESAWARRISTYKPLALCLGRHATVYYTFIQLVVRSFASLTSKMLRATGHARMVRQSSTTFT